MVLGWRGIHEADFKKYTREEVMSVWRNIVAPSKPSSLEAVSYIVLARPDTVLDLDKPE